MVSRTTPLKLPAEADGVVLEGGRDTEDRGDVFRGEALSGGSLEIDPSPVKEEETLAILPRHVEVVDDKENGLMLLAVDAEQEFKDFKLVGDIEIGNRFVE